MLAFALICSLNYRWNYYWCCTIVSYPPNLIHLAAFSFASGIQSGEMSQAEAIGMIATFMATMGTTILISYTIGILYFTLWNPPSFRLRLVNWHWA